MGTSNGQREIEVKLDASAGFRLPRLSDLPGVVRVVEADRADLDAVYLDSPDLRLIRNGTTLRRRTGGSDAGWHLKLPVAADERLEIRRAPGRSARTVPATLKDLVSVHLRGEALEPVARISTRRAVYQLVGKDDVVLAEVSDDEVTGEALGGTMTTDSWREIEVELVHGDRTVLDAARKALTRSGARSSAIDAKLRRVLARRLEELHGAGTLGAQLAERSPGRAGKRFGKSAVGRAGDVVVGYLKTQLAALTAADPPVKLDAEESVHDMRVATRRLRTTLAAFRPLFAPGTVEPLRAELKWLGAELGAVRDADVLLHGFERRLAEQPEELVVGPVARRIGLELREQRTQARAGLLEALASDRYLDLIGAVERFIADPPFSERASARPDRELRRCVSKACRRVRRAHAELGELPPGPDRDHQAHRVRIAAKRARYAAEAAATVCGSVSSGSSGKADKATRRTSKGAKKLVEALKRVQVRLGDHQDAVMQRATLRDLAMRAFLAGENGFTFGRLHGLAEASADRDLEGFRRDWKLARRRMAHWPG